MIQFTPKLYTGAHFSEIFSEMIYANNTLDRNLVRVLQGIKSEQVLTSMGGAPVIQAYTTTPTTPQGTITFSDAVIKPVKQQVHARFDMNEFIGTRFSDDMPAGAANIESNEFLRNVLAYLIPRVGKSIEAKFWDMLETKLTGSPAIDVAGSVLTAANILDEIKKVYQAIPGQVLKAKEAVIYMPEEVESLLLMANADRTYRDLLTVSDAGIKYLNAPIEFVPLSDNTIIAGRKSDLVLGTDLVSDQANLNVGFVSPESDLMFYRMVFTLDAAVCSPAQKVLYKVA